MTYANLTATLALFIALGGGAYAASLPRNSVGARQLRAGAVERAKIKKNAVNDAKVQDDSLGGSDIREGSLGKVPSASAADAAVNSAHANFAAALDKLTYKSAAGTAPANAGTAVTVPCDPGQRVVGGGEQVADPAVAFVVDSYPEPAGTAWTSRVASGGGAPQNFTVYAICAAAAGAG